MAEPCNGSLPSAWTMIATAAASIEGAEAVRQAAEEAARTGTPAAEAALQERLREMPEEALERVLLAMWRGTVAVMQLHPLQFTREP